MCRRRQRPMSAWSLRVLLADGEEGYRQDLARIAPHGKAASADEVAAARETVQRLSLPWGKLFAAIEGAASDQVALLAIEPDTKNGTVKISGDSKEYLAAFERIDALAPPAWLIFEAD